MSLKSPKEHFASPAIYSLNITSEYNSESWELIPSFSNQNTRSYLAFRTQRVGLVAGNEKEGKGLDLEITMPISIKRSRLLRSVEVLGDVALAFGTLYLAISKLYENRTPPVRLPEWYLVVGISFLIGIFAKSFVKIRRG